MKPEMPLISIVTPIYNAEAHLQKTLESVLAQTYQNWEQWLVIDANSSDRSLEIALKFERADKRFHVLASPNFHGVSNNRNAALDASRGQYFAFLDADDIWIPEKLEVQLKFMLENHGRISCHAYTPINEKDQIAGPTRKVPAKIHFDDLLADNSIGCLTVMIERSFLANRRFEAVKHEDLALWLKLLANGDFALGLPESLAFYRVLGSSVSSNKLKAATWRWNLYRQMGFSINRSLFLLAKYFYFAIRKRTRG